MYDQPFPQSILFFMLYAAVAMTAIIASCYLLLRRGNAFAPDNTPPIRLRRWTAAFFASMALAHLWYLPTAFPTSSGNVPVIYVYLLLLVIGLTIYIIRALRQYGRWLRDNYADLEHKEVWQTFIVLASILLLLSYYVFGAGGPTYEYIIQISGFAFVCYLLWRVETLSDLSISHPLSCSTEEATVIEDTERNGLPQATYDNISSLLQRFCIDTQLYLQHDLTLSHLAQAIGTNRTYLTNYFSNQGITYNTIAVGHLSYGSRYT
jgi:hypothetical protein